MTSTPRHKISPLPTKTMESRQTGDARRFLPAFLLAMLLATGIQPQKAHAGDAEEGREIATRWCSSCHNVGTGDRPAASDAVPTFDSIAQRDNFNRVQLEAWIGNPHPPMPNFNLSRDEIDSLVSYIESLRPNR